MCQNSSKLFPQDNAVYKEEISGFKEHIKILYKEINSLKVNYIWV